MTPHKLIIIFNSLNIGGIETKIIDTVKYLDQNYPQIEILLCLKKREGQLLAQIPSRISILSPYHLKSNLIQSTLYPFWLSRIIKNTQPDKIITFGNYCAISSIIAKLLSLSKTPVIISEDSSITTQIKTDKFPNARYLLLKLTYPFAHKIITLSSIGKIKLLHILKNISSSKIITLQNWLPLAYSQKIHLLPTTSRPVDILFIGRFVQQKNPIRFINIINQIHQTFPSVRCQMVGYGPLESTMQSHISQLNLHNNISIIPPTTNPRSYYSNSKILLLSSDHEGFPLVLLEAHACKCLTVVPRLGEIKSYYQQFYQQLTYTSDKTAVKIICRLLNNLTLCQTITKYYYQLVFQHQSANFNKYINILLNK
jgi:glycosyltransferase involved in cell wall biosynthesis